MFSGNLDQLSLEMEKERQEYLTKSKTLQDQLKELKSEIQVLKVEEAVSPLDRLHSEHAARGLGGKYDTLRRATQNSAKARVAFFEEL